MSTELKENTHVSSHEYYLDFSRGNPYVSDEIRRPNEYTFDKVNSTCQDSSGSDVLYCTVPSLGYLLKQEERRLHDKYSSFDNPKICSNDSLRESLSVKRNFKADYGGQKCQIPARHCEQTYGKSRSQP